MANPNRCETCTHKKHPDGGHCYMFRDEPTDVCMQHTGRRMLGFELLMAVARYERDKPSNGIGKPTQAAGGCVAG